MLSESMLIELKPMVGLMKTDKDMMKPVVGGDNGDSGRDCWRGNNATSALHCALCGAWSDLPGSIVAKTIFDAPFYTIN